MFEILTSHNRADAELRSSGRADPSVPIPKFLFNFGMNVEGSLAESFDGSQDVVGGFGPAEWLGIGVAGSDIAVDGGFELSRRAMGAALDLLFGQQREEALDLVDP